MAEFHDVAKVVRRKRSFSRCQLHDRARRPHRAGGREWRRQVNSDQTAGGQLEPLTSGEYRLGHNVQADYFAQDQYKELDPDARILDDLGELSPRSTQTELRSLLGCFLFSADDVFKRIGVLSGGERNRYALLRMLLHPANFLLLDEPTNHLDMRAKDVLLECACEYTAPLFLFPTTATSSTSWRRESLKSAMAEWKCIPEITKTISGERRRRGETAGDGKPIDNHRAAGKRQPKPGCGSFRQVQAVEPDQAEATGRTRARTRNRNFPRGNRDRRLRSRAANICQCR